MNTQDFMNCIYDLLAQNPVSGAYGMSGREHDYITSLIDHVDTERNVIEFVNPETGVAFELQLVGTYSPGGAAANSMGDCEHLNFNDNLLDTCADCGLVDESEE